MMEERYKMKRMKHEWSGRTKIKKSNDKRQFVVIDTIDSVFFSFQQEQQNIPICR